MEKHTLMLSKEVIYYSSGVNEGKDLAHKQ